MAHPRGQHHSQRVPDGVGQLVTTNVFLAGNASARVLVPPDGALGSTWIQPGFNHNAWLNGPLGVGFETEVPGFAVHNYKANIFVDSLAAADGVIANPAQQVNVVSENAALINYFNTGSDGHYGNNRPFPGQTINVDVEDFVIEATATITFPSAGPWTFGVNSDDGFRLVIGSFQIAYPSPRGPDDTLGAFNVPAADAQPERFRLSASALQRHQPGEPRVAHAPDPL